jgi:hypothetical protein
MRAVSMAFVLAFTFGMMTGQGWQATATLPAAPPAASDECGSSRAQLRTTLYFGTSKPKGAVSELEWQVFLRDEVTVRFPDGLTVWDAEGQWKGISGAVEQERSKVLLLVHPDTPAARGSIQQVIAKYRQVFEQESVLWETARVCIAM